MPLSLPDRPSLEWLRKTAKQTLKQLRAQDSSARLADAQLAVAREYGFESWRKLKRHVDTCERLAAAPPSASELQLTSDQIVQGFLTIRDEDITICKAVQGGLGSRFAEPGRLCHLEKAIWQLARYVAARVGNDMP